MPQVAEASEGWQNRAPLRPRTKFKRRANANEPTAWETSHGSTDQRGPRASLRRTPPACPHCEPKPRRRPTALPDYLSGCQVHLVNKNTVWTPKSACFRVARRMEASESWRGYATICRLCMHRDGFMLGIFNHIRGKEKSIYRKIMDCTDLQISSGDGLPTCICHRCLFKIELCLEFKQQCSMSDATLRQINGLPKQPDVAFDTAKQNYTQEDDVIMVVDPLVLDYDSEYDSDNDQQSDVENPELNDLYEFRNVFMCKYCDQAFTGKIECAAHEGSAHNHSVPYTCAECDMGFGDRGQYSAHLKSVHQNDKPYNCPQCERTFARRSDLRKHTVVHTGIKPFTCNVCFKSFSRNTNLSKHMRIHSGQKPFVCPKCPKTFISKGDLTRHAIIHSGQKPFRCNYCHLSFGRRDKLLRHEKRHFPQNSEDKSQELEIMRQSLSLNDFGYNSVKDESENHLEPIAEQDKQEEWTSSENMVINLDPFNHNSYGNPESTPQSDLHSEVEPADADQELPRIPEHIKTEAMENSVLDEERELPHIPEHITGDSFSVKDEIKPKPINTVIKRYPCLRCSKRFSNQEGLRLHMASHTNDRPHNCIVCSKSFLRKRELDRHLATHTGMKPFKCPSCDKRFGRKDKLVRHIRIHDINREHICVICGASFNRKDGLAHHMKTHARDITDMALNNL